MANCQTEKERLKQKFEQKDAELTLDKLSQGHQGLLKANCETCYLDMLKQYNFELSSDGTLNKKLSLERKSHQKTKDNLRKHSNNITNLEQQLSKANSKLSSEIKGHS